MTEPAYPEILGSAVDDFFYDGSAGQLAARLESLAGREDFGLGDAQRARGAVARFDWKRRAEEMDRRLEELTGSV